MRSIDRIEQIDKNYQNKTADEKEGINYEEKES